MLKSIWYVKTYLKKIQLFPRLSQNFNQFFRTKIKPLGVFFIQKNTIFQKCCKHGLDS